jgi:hypothetical protein
MQEMTAEEYRSFLLDRARTASFRTVLADGRTWSPFGSTRRRHLCLYRGRDDGEGKEHEA